VNPTALFCSIARIDPERTPPSQKIPNINTEFKLSAEDDNLHSFFQPTHFVSKTCCATKARCVTTVGPGNQ